MPIFSSGEFMHLLPNGLLRRSRHLLLRSVITITTLAGCGGGGGGEPSRDPANLEIIAGDNQSAPVRTAVPILPRVKVTDDHGAPVSGVLVTFAITIGNGTLSGATPRTDANGVATIGEWVLGSFVGNQALNASVLGLSAVLFDAVATAGNPVSVAAVTSQNQTGLIAAALQPPPAVKVSDQFGNGVPGIPVTFAITQGSGSVTGASTTTDAGGVATVGSWVLDSSPGPNTMTATVQGGLLGNPVTFNATGAVTAYAVDLVFLSTMSPGQTQAFINAEHRLEAVIIGDVPDVPINISQFQCLPGQPAMSQTVDDVVIFAQLAVIDGPGQVLAQAGPCVVRGNTNFLPAVGVMQFDLADIGGLESGGNLQNVILHEMLHVLGFGSIWTSKGLLSGGGGTTPSFTGPFAIGSFDSIGGAAFIGARVPVENTGGAGTRDSHWRETVLKQELMTGFLTGSNPMSVVTVNSLRDLGYTVVPTQADNFLIQPPFVAPPAAARTGFDLLNDEWRGPLFEADRSGRLTPVPRQ